MVDHPGILPGQYLTLDAEGLPPAPRPPISMLRDASGKKIWAALGRAGNIEMQGAGGHLKLSIDHGWGRSTLGQYVGNGRFFIPTRNELRLFSCVFGRYVDAQQNADTPPVPATLTLQSGFQLRRRKGACCHPTDSNKWWAVSNVSVMSQ
jgi:hypothetical protein